ncbi:sensor histidine kinase [Paractinoplanes hotanensis]|uniref:histidine kinase n=1 Tax=Paractinoplanes hotanensis TaxID=2906497 RepID=A0ABT0Y9Y3_9ACTN|nr:histidine kinase [Actinoplanes hotanensis]MCM4082857.1 histidine kinase [Actinoplanes hotanensis]
MSSLLFALLVPGPPGNRPAVVRDRTADFLALLIALFYGAIMVPLGDATSSQAAIPWQADVAIGVACLPALLLRRRWPLGLCLALLPLGAISVMATGPILVALFTVAIRRRATLMLGLAAVHVGTGVVYYALQHDPPFDLWVDLLLRSVTVLAAVGWGLFLRAYRHLTSSLRTETANERAQQQLRMEQARLTERARIAREMHDVLAHRMSMVSLHAGALEVRSDARPDEIATAARTIRISAHEALEELRSVIGILRQPATSGQPRSQPNGDGDSELLTQATDSTPEPTSSTPAPASSTLGTAGPARLAEDDDLWDVGDEPQAEGVAERLERLVVEPPQPRFWDLPELLDGARTAGMNIDFAWVVPRAAPSQELGRTAYRVVQEALTNARKHAPGSDVRVMLDGGGDRDLRILVDNSLGSWHGDVREEELPGSGTGLIGVGERVALVGGRVEYGADGDRFRLEAWLPWQE